MSCSLVLFGLELSGVCIDLLIVCGLCLIFLFLGKLFLWRLGLFF